MTRTRSPHDNCVVIVELTAARREIADRTPLGGLHLLRRRLARLAEGRLAEIDGVLLEIMDLMGASDIQ